MNPHLRPTFRAPDHPDPKEERQAERKRFLKWAAALLVMLLIVGAGLVWGWPKVNRALERRALSRAEEFYRQNDFRQMLLTLEQIVQVDPRNVMARLQLAEFYEKTGSPRVLEVWRDLIALDPANDDYRLRLARAALQLQNSRVASDALAGVSETGKMTSDYHRVQTGLALISGDEAGLARGLDVLAKGEPNDERIKFSRAVILAWSSEPAKKEEGSGLLVELAKGEKLRIRAALELLKLAGQQQDTAAVLRVAQEVVPKPRNSIASLLTGGPGPRELADYLKAQPEPEPQDVAALALWLSQRGQALDALHWMELQSTATQSNRQVMEAKATCAAQTKDWARLHAVLRQGAWGPVSDDVWLLAMAARLQRSQSALVRSRETWGDAVALASSSRNALRGLIRLAGTFGWPEETERTLWAFARKFPAERAPWIALIAGAETEGSTETLWQIYREWSAALPNEVPIHAEQMLLALLIGKEAELSTTQLRSLQNALVETTTLPAAAWAARGLWLTRNGDPAGALVAASRALTFSGNSPRVKLACALVLAENSSEREAAKKLLGELTNARFLPEERAHFQRLRTQLGAP